MQRVDPSPISSSVRCGAEHAPFAGDPAARGLSVVIPAYNEERGIAVVLDHVRAALHQVGGNYEIIVVDDGSHDRTRAVVQAHHPDITLLTHPLNRGYGAALKTGFRHARYDLVCMTDADGTYPPDRIPDLLAYLHEHNSDMVVGVRTGEQVAIPLMRRPAKWVIGQLANFVCGQTIPDVNSGFRLLRRESALHFLALLPDGFSFTTTITLGMVSSNHAVGYVPIDYHVRIGTSKIRPLRDTLNFVQLILRVALYFAPLKIFLPLSGLLIVLAVAWGLFTYFVLGQLADVTTMLIAMTGVQVATFGLLAELINHRAPGPYRKGD